MEQHTHELSLAGTPAAGPRGYVSWAFGQGARDPYYILVVIYIFYPYFSNTVVGDPIEGQSLLGYTNTVRGRGRGRVGSLSCVLCTTGKY